MPDKYRLAQSEIDMLLEGLSAAAREYARMAHDADRLGFGEVADRLRDRAVAFEGLLINAMGVDIEKITVRFS